VSAWGCHVACVSVPPAVST